MKHDENLILFSNGSEEVRYGDFVKCLIQLGANECDVLFVHSDVSFGKIQKGIKRKELMQYLTDALMETEVKTLIFPTFTFSFCNKEDYDVENSPTAMGMLPEYIRKREDAHRTNDPILSVAILGDKDGFEQMTDVSSCGKGGIFHQLHTCGKKVKFLFFGTTVMKCFTFLHYVEEMKQVPYRYSREFTGRVIRNGQTEEKTVSVYVRYKDVTARLPKDMDMQLINKGIMSTKKIGASTVSIVDERTSYDFICGLIDADNYVFSVLPENGELLEEYKYGNVVTM